MKSKTKIPFFREFSALHTALGLQYESGYTEIDLFNYEDAKNCPAEMGPFRNNFYQVFFIHHSALDGKYNDTELHFIKEKSYLFFTCPGKLISWQKKGDLHGYIFSFKPSFILTQVTASNFLKKFSFFNPDENFSIELTDKTAVEMVQYGFTRINTEYKGNLSGSHEVICHHLFILLISVNRLLPPAGNIRSNLINKREKAVLQKEFEALVRKDLAAGRTVKYYAKALAVTPKYLSETLKKESGKTARQIIQDILVLEAKSLLLQTGMGTSEVGEKLGFADASHFIKMFKAKTGKTPSAFVKQ